MGHSDGAVPVVLAAAAAARWAVSFSACMGGWLVLTWQMGQPVLCVLDAAMPGKCSQERCGGPGKQTEPLLCVACRGSCSGLGGIGPIDRSQSASEAEALTATRAAQQMPR